MRATGRQRRPAEVAARWITPDLAARDREVLAQLRAMLTGIDEESYAQCCEAIAGMDQRDDLARIAAPTLVIGGADDLATPVDHQRVLADRIPRARLEIVIAQPTSRPSSNRGESPRCCASTSAAVRRSRAVCDPARRSR